MAFWRVVAHKDFPVWALARRLVEREKLDGDRVRWLLEASDFILAYPRSSKGIHSVEAAEPEAGSVDAAPAGAIPA